MKAAAVKTNKKNESRAAANAISQQKKDQKGAVEFAENQAGPAAARLKSAPKGPAASSKFKPLCAQSQDKGRHDKPQKQRRVKPNGDKANTTITNGSGRAMQMMTTKVKEEGPERKPKCLYKGEEMRMGENQKPSIKQEHPKVIDYYQLSHDPLKELDELKLYGLSTPQQLEFETDVDDSLDGDYWQMDLMNITGKYVMLFRLFDNQTDVTGAEQATTAKEANEIIAAFDALGEPEKDHNWYNLKAVEMHERVHASRLLPALQNKEKKIEQWIEEARIPLSEAKTYQEARRKIESSKEIDLSERKMACYVEWYNEYMYLVAGDHKKNGPTEKAERAVTDPIKKAIKEKQIKNKWVSPPEDEEKEHKEDDSK